MKQLFFITALLAVTGRAMAQPATNAAAVVITSHPGPIAVIPLHDGSLQLTISPATAAMLAAKGFVSYRDFGAAGDGKTDDIDAIAATHAWANQQQLPVKANDTDTYYISGKARTAVIRTSTDFGRASFIIDDRAVQSRTTPVMMVSSGMLPFTLEGIQLLKRNQEKINVSLPGSCLISVTNSDVKQYIRFGLNQDNGAAQTDIFVADRYGRIDPRAPVLWDFTRITSITALPIDTVILRIKGGRFTTIANAAEAKYTYYERNFAVRRSNVLIDGMEHRITGEGTQGAPYGGFINIGECAYVTVRNTMLTGHTTYNTIGTAGKPVSMGTYDISINRAANISFINCSQTNDINDARYWGILGSNYCKNLLYDSCRFSRFDAHKGVANATIRNSELGHMGINAIGSGTFLVENTTVRGKSMINLRSDYGSTWQGEFIIRNCVFIPSNGKAVSASLINGAYTGKHNFGYTCYMPERITIDKLHIDDSQHPSAYEGPAVFADFNPEKTSNAYSETYPYVITKKITLRNISTASGKPLRVSDNRYMFKEVITDNQ